MRCSPGAPSTRQASSMSTPAARDLSSSCRPLRASTPRPWARSRARWPMPRPNAAPSRSSTGRARASGRRAGPGRSRGARPGTHWRGWAQNAGTCWLPAAGAGCIVAGRPSPSRTTGCSSPPAWRAAPARPRRPRSARSAGRWRGRSPPPAQPRAGLNRTGCCHWLRSSSRRTCMAGATGRPNAPTGAGRRAIRSMSSAPPPAAP